MTPFNRRDLSNIRNRLEAVEQQVIARRPDIADLFAHGVLTEFEILDSLPPDIKELMQLCLEFTALEVTIRMTDRIESALALLN